MEFGGFCFVFGIKFSVFNEVLRKVMKLFSDIENSEEFFVKVGLRGFFLSVYYDFVVLVFKIKK